MNNLIIYFIGYILAYLSLKFIVREGSYTRKDIFLTFILSLGSYAMLLAVIVIGLLKKIKKIDMDKDGPKWL